MGVAAVFDEEEVRLLLAGSSEDLAKGLRLIDRQLRLKLSKWLRHRFPGLTSSELSECWSELLEGIYRSVRSGGFDVDKPLLPFVCTILRRRAIDKLRRNDDGPEVLEQIGYALRDTSVGAKWRMLNEAARGEVHEQIMAAIAPLPEKQRVVVQAYADGYPKTEEDVGELVRLVSERTRKPETVVAVKSSLREGLKKVRERLDRRGYGLADSGEE
jgi:DNA-directed RNA polymerase specialized sigma24 family protein